MENKRLKFKKCFVDYDGDRTFLITPEFDKHKQFSVTFDIINEALVVLKKLDGTWKRRNGKLWTIRNPVKYFESVAYNQHVRTSNENMEKLVKSYKYDYLDDDEEMFDKCANIFEEE